jgi:hypothetical protein
MKPTKEQIQQHYTQAVESALDAFSQLDDKRWNKKAASKWTAKDFLAHLVIIQEEQANALTRQALAGESGQVPGYDERDGVDAHNESTLAKVRDLPVPELLNRMKAAFQEHLQLLDGLSEADLDKPATSPGWDRPGTVRDLFFASYLHLPGHYQDIRRVDKKKLPHWMERSTPDQVHYHLDRTFNYMPLIFWSSRGADVNATYLFTMEGEGGGQWSIQIGDGKAESQDGATDSFDMELKTKPQLWMDLSTNDLNAMTAIAMRKVKLGGNAGLAMKLGQLFQVSGD